MTVCVWIDMIMFHYSFGAKAKLRVPFEKSIKSLVFHIDKVIKRQIAGKEIIMLENLVRMRSPEWPNRDREKQLETESVSGMKREEESEECIK